MSITNGEFIDVLKLKHIIKLKKSKNKGTIEIYYNRRMIHNNRKRGKEVNKKISNCRGGKKEREKKKLTKKKRNKDQIMTLNTDDDKLKKKYYLRIKKK